MWSSGCRFAPLHDVLDRPFISEVSAAHFFRRSWTTSSLPARAAEWMARTPCARVRGVEAEVKYASVVKGSRHRGIRTF